MIGMNLPLLTSLLASHQVDLLAQRCNRFWHSGAGTIQQIAVDFDDLMLPDCLKRCDLAPVTDAVAGFITDQNGVRIRCKDSFPADCGRQLGQLAKDIRGTAQAERLRNEVLVIERHQW